jgi:Icc-related predicted phosphoesterase
MANLRIAAVGDLHYKRGQSGIARDLLGPLHDEADVLLLCGDLADRGLPEEARALADELASSVRIPMLGVLGNHDFEAGQEQEVTDILRSAGVILLDGECHEVGGIGFVGVKGFGGGFGRHALEPWGEPPVKQFVAAAVDEAMKLESALARLHTATKVVLLHYAPIAATVNGEAAEILPFLGSSRLEEPLDRYGVAAVFHGHAHNGTARGETRGGVAVYNVALPLLRRALPARPVRIVEIAAERLAESA